MKDEKVSFKVAKLAKEKGFNEPCSYYYILNFQNFKADGILYKCSLPDNCDSTNIFQYVKRTKQFHLANAPTQSLLQRWLREKYNLNIVIDYLSLSRKWCGEVYDIITSEYINDLDDTYDSFEEALDATLEEALNFIENGS